MTHRALAVALESDLIYIGARRVGRPGHSDSEESPSLFWSFWYLALRCLLQLAFLRPRSEQSKDLEIVWGAFIRFSGLGSRTRG